SILHAQRVGNKPGTISKEDGKGQRANVFVVRGIVVDVPRHIDNEYSRCPRPSRLCNPHWTGGREGLATAGPLCHISRTSGTGPGAARSRRIQRDETTR